MSYWSWYSNRWDEDNEWDDNEDIDEWGNNDTQMTTNSKEKFECFGFWNSPPKPIYLGGTIHLNKDMKGYVIQRKYCNSEECNSHSNTSHCFKDCDKCKCTKCNCYYCLLTCHNPYSKSK